MARSSKPGDESAGAPPNSESNVQGNASDLSSTETSRSESIARRAYERYQERGGEHGHDQEDWFEAEQELDDGFGDERG